MINSTQGVLDRLYAAQSAESDTTSNSSRNLVSSTNIKSPQIIDLTKNNSFKTSDKDTLSILNTIMDKKLLILENSSEKGSVIPIQSLYIDLPLKAQNPKNPFFPTPKENKFKKPLLHP